MDVKDIVSCGESGHIDCFVVVARGLLRRGGLVEARSSAVVNREIYLCITRQGVGDMEHIVNRVGKERGIGEYRVCVVCGVLGLHFDMVCTAFVLCVEFNRFVVESEGDTCGIIARGCPLADGLQ